MATVRQSGTMPVVAESGDRGGIAESETGKAASIGRRLKRSIIGVSIVLVGVYAVLLFTAGGAEVLAEVAELDPRLLVLPFIATLLSYITMSLSYEGIARAAGAPVRSRDMLRITFIANTANYILPSGGLSGFALRLVFFTKKGMSAGRAVAVSFTQTLITNLMLVVFIVYGLLNLVFMQNVEGVSVTAAAVVASVLTLALGLCVAMIYARPLRRRVMMQAARLVDRVLDATGYQDRFGHRATMLLQHVSEGMELFAANPKAMIVPSFWIFLDWLFTIGVLYSAFYSVGYPATFSQVVIAFSLSIVVALMSFVPGGVGFLEGALTASFAGLGIPMKASVVPILLFRLSFYLLPAVLAVILARGAFSEDVEEPAAEAP